MIFAGVEFAVGFGSGQRGSSIAARIAMMAITTSNSIKVKAAVRAARDGFHGFIDYNFLSLHTRLLSNLDFFEPVYYNLVSAGSAPRSLTNLNSPIMADGACLTFIVWPFA